MSRKANGQESSARRRKEVSVVIAPATGRDPALIDSTIREWIVPLLVRNFLAEHPIAVSANEANSNNSTTGMHDEEGAA